MSKPTYEQKLEYIRNQKDSRLKIGDAVKVFRMPHEGENGWNKTPDISERKRFIGKSGNITDVDEALGFRVENCDNFWWPYFVLQLDYSTQKPSSTSDSYTDRQRDSGLKEGDMVRITRKVEGHSDGWSNSWASDMDDYVGKTGKILHFSGASGVGVGFDGKDYACYSWPFFVLEKVSDSYVGATGRVIPPMVPDYPADKSVFIREGKATVIGCFTPEELETIAAQARANV